MKKEPKGEVVDLFCGVGALSYGLKQAGFEIMAGFDVDYRCEFAYKANNKAEFVKRDIKELQAGEILSHYSGKKIKVLAGCAPCQPFSTYKFRYDEDPQWNLVKKFADLATEVLPDFITMENVPRLEKFRDGTVLKYFITCLEKCGYSVKYDIFNCVNFGVPQKRRRLVLIAAKSKNVSLPVPEKKEIQTVEDAIGNGKLSKLAAGETCPKDSLHKCRNLSELNLRRIKKSEPGKTWKDWPFELRAECHKRESGSTYSEIYARMEWDKPSPTITTQCCGFGNGRFGHPEQDRAISLREAALLQSFPKEYKFLRRNEKPKITEIARWIGNAVPVKLARAIGNQIIKIQNGE